MKEYRVLAKAVFYVEARNEREAEEKIHNLPMNDIELSDGVYFSVIETIDEIDEEVELDKGDD